jgi:hypothetical protein
MPEVTIEMFNELKSKLASFEKLHADFQHWNNSRRGVQGGRGETGTPGRDGKNSEIPGPQGAPGRNGQDANIGESVAAAQAAMERELAAFRAALSGAIAQELKTAGVVDEAGKAILIPGPAGQNSVVPGPAGASIVGPAGKDAAPAKDGRDAVVRIGNVLSGDIASVTVRETPEGQVLDFVLPRGQRGETGAASQVAGPEGKPGRDMTEEMDAFRSEINKQVGVISIQLENRLRRIWKDDAQAAIRGHLVESHKN